jgi:hypothetical protein
MRNSRLVLPDMRDSASTLSAVPITARVPQSFMARWLPFKVHVTARTQGFCSRADLRTGCAACQRDFNVARAPNARGKGGFCELHRLLPVDTCPCYPPDELPILNIGSGSVLGRGAVSRTVNESISRHVGAHSSGAGALINGARVSRTSSTSQISSGGHFLTFAICSE